MDILLNIDTTTDCIDSIEPLKYPAEWQNNTL
jgi:hypothetical protein